MGLPTEALLEQYARVLVASLDEGNGIRSGDVVGLRVWEWARPMLEPLQTAVLRAGGNPLFAVEINGLAKSFYENASEEQLKFFPRTFYEGYFEQVQHQITVYSEVPGELTGVDQSKVSLRSQHNHRLSMFEKRYDDKKLTWTLGTYGTAPMAAEAHMSLDEYWEQITKACYLEASDPVEEWKKTRAEIMRVRNQLDALGIESLFLEADGTALTMKLANRRWLGGTGRNVPSFEVFTTPHWQSVHGTIAFNLPLYENGDIIRDLRLRFERGEVVEATASQGQAALDALVSEPGMKRVGEFSLTDKRLSHIDRWMANTLFDENHGGAHGNTHIALGAPFLETYTGDAALTDENRNALGFNESANHVDIVATSDRIVTAQLRDGSRKEIYRDGQFTI